MLGNDETCVWALFIFLFYMSLSIFIDLFYRSFFHVKKDHVLGEGKTEINSAWSIGLFNRSHFYIHRSLLHDSLNIHRQIICI